MALFSDLTLSMQKDDTKSLEKYIKAKSKQSQVDLSGEAGCSCLGAPIGTGGGVNAVEAIPTVNVFPVCSATECLDSSIDQKFTKDKGRSSRRVDRADQQDAIVGEIAHAPGESTLAASAIAGEAVEPKKRGMRYNPNDFTPYSRRFR